MFQILLKYLDDPKIYFILCNTNNSIIVISLNNLSLYLMFSLLITFTALTYLDTLWTALKTLPYAPYPIFYKKIKIIITSLIS